MIKLSLPIVSDAFSMARESLKSQRLRAILTALIIAIGITALVGMLTAISVMENSLTGQFTSMGANTFTVQSGGMRIQIGSNGIQQKRQQAIPLRTAKRLAQRVSEKGMVGSVSDDVSGTSTVQYLDRKTNPNVRVMASDGNFMVCNGLDLSEGRYFSQLEQNEARAVCVLGADVASSLFPQGDGIGKTIRMAAKPYRVVGITQAKGSSSMFSSDQVIYLPLMTGHYAYGNNASSYVTSVMAKDAASVDLSIAEATVVMRGLRKLRPGETDNFNIRRSDAIATMLVDSLGFVSSGALLIALITLLGASVALMNIMLVSVTERTKEIGIRKALGASKNTIVLQFLAEAITVSMIGGLAGIVIGLGLGNLLALQWGSPFAMPTTWLTIALFISAAVGILSGWYPAKQAASMDPIEALRHE